MPTYNHRERILAAMNLEKPDRVPVMSQFSIGFMSQQIKEIGITPMELWLDVDKFSEALIWLRDRFDFDGILVGIHGHDLNWRDKIRKLEIIDGVEKATFDNRIETYVDDDLPVGHYFEPREKNWDDVHLDDIPEKLDYIAASKDSIVYIDDTEPYKIFDILEEKTQGKYSLHGEVSSPLDYLLDLVGYENGLLAMMTEPEKAIKILEKYTLGVVQMAEGLAAHKSVDAIKISSPFAGMGFMSPDFYRRFELPYLAQVSEAIKKKGKFAYVHTCGSIDDRLEIMAESGVSGLECLDPPPIGNVELNNAFKRIGEKMFIKGNIDSVNTLLKGNEALIRKDVESRLQIGMQNPGFILSTACSIAPKVEKEKVQLLAKIVRESGVYKKT
jgi:uroporphyrinogen-III decarboxylase